MAVIIGHSSIDERGKISGGAAGDQTGKEVCTRNFYNHKKGWFILRPLDPNDAEKIANCMEDICANDCIGYDQNERLDLYATVKSLNFYCDIKTLKVKVECDCSSAVRVCLAYAGIKVGNFTTANEKAVIMATGKFECLECKPDGSNLKRGDILVTKTKGHTVVVLSNGSQKGSGYMFKPSTVKKGSKGKSVLLMQMILRGKGYKGKDGKLLKLDGDCQTNSVYAINTYQTDRRKAGVELGTNKKNDSVCGSKMWADLIGL